MMVQRFLAFLELHKLLLAHSYITEKAGLVPLVQCLGTEIIY